MFSGALAGELERVRAAVAREPTADASPGSAGAQPRAQLRSAPLVQHEGS